MTSAPESSPTADAPSLIERVGNHSAVTVVVLAGLVGGGLLYVTGFQAGADLVWGISVALVLIPLTWSVLSALRKGQLGVDLIALLAMAGALLTGEYLAGAVIALMLAGGNALEERAQGRAGRELSELVQRAPREAHVRRDDEIVEIRADEVVVGDVVVIRAGEIVPVDGVVLSESATIDQSAMTGEPIPVSAAQGDSIVSGSANVGNSFEMKALRTSGESMYAGIVSLVEDAVARKAPMVRMADRYSVLFLIVTLSLAAGSWIATGDPIRALAVLVVATPCPLILAPPVALVAGTSRAARRGVIVKGSAAIERLGRASAVLIDKTGTITHGTPSISRIVPGPNFTEGELLELAGAVEQMSVHSIAEEIAHAASSAGKLPLATDVDEFPGHGISATVMTRRVLVGSSSYLKAAGIELPEMPSGGQAVAVAYVAVDQQFAGHIELSDVVRDDAPELVTRLRELGITQITMATGDDHAAASRVAADVGISDFVAECTPQMKLDVLAQLRARADGRAVVMVGDGVNDAPALAAADVGIAMGSAGATAASESAEAIILANRVSLVADAIAIGQRSRNIAWQSVIIGMSLSMIGMVFAAAGLLTPVYGALTQEAIDLAVILNALRALRDPKSLSLPTGPARQ